MSEVRPWWETLDDAEAEHLAKKLATIFTFFPADTVIVSGPVQSVHTPSGEGFVIFPGAPSPLWTHFLRAARACLDSRDEIQIDATFVRGGTDSSERKTPQGWRDERGLTDDGT